MATGLRRWRPLPQRARRDRPVDRPRARSRWHGPPSPDPPLCSIGRPRRLDPLGRPGVDRRPRLGTPRSPADSGESPIVRIRRLPVLPRTSRRMGSRRVVRPPRALPVHLRPDPLPTPRLPERPGPPGEPGAPRRPSLRRGASRRALCPVDWKSLSSIRQGRPATGRAEGLPSAEACSSAVPTCSIDPSPKSSKSSARSSISSRSATDRRGTWRDRRPLGRLRAQASVASTPFSTTSGAPARPRRLAEAQGREPGPGHAGHRVGRSRDPGQLRQVAGGRTTCGASSPT